MQQLENKYLYGKELADTIQADQRARINARKSLESFNPMLAIVQVKDDPVIHTYVRLKQRYGNSIGCNVTVHKIPQNQAKKIISSLNDDPKTHGIIVQLPLEDVNETETILNTVAPQKDVDGLAKKTTFLPATPTAIMWLLAHYKITLDARVGIVGRGRLVGDPLVRQLQKQGIEPAVYDKTTVSLKQALIDKDIIITATGNPGLITSDMIKPGAIIIDAGTSTDGNAIVGDVDQRVYARDDIFITPQKGGIGPLTVCALFENVLTAAQNLQ